MTVVSVDVPKGLREEIEQEVEKGRYTSKSEVIRDALRRMMRERHKEDKKLSEQAEEDILEAKKQ